MSRASDRRGAVLVLLALMMISLIGMLGLVIDSGLLMSQQRQVQNVADAAALAAARDLLGGRSNDSAKQTAIDFIVTYNGMTAPGANDIRIPPTTGPYAGVTGYVEVVLTQDVNSYFIQVLPGVGSIHSVSARAVAGYEAHSAGEGVALLDPRDIDKSNSPPPGLLVAGTGVLRVNGGIVVNAQGAGYDEDGGTVEGLGSGYAADGGSTDPLKGTIAQDVRVVGGVANVDSFKPYDSGGPNPLKTRQPPQPDPLINLPTPTTALGIDPSFRGSVKVLSNSVQGLSTDTSGKNHIAVANENVEGKGYYTASAGEIILYPGVYNKIEIQGGKVFLIPGIYVLKAADTKATLSITGGTTLASGVMFYNTGSNFDTIGGFPDINDGSQRPPLGDGALLGAIEVTGGPIIRFEPIKTSRYNYAELYSGARAVSSKFDGMLFYQRRANQQTLKLTGGGANTALLGTVYAKWATFDVLGQATYQAQFIIGKINVGGGGDVTILAAGTGWGKANDVYLVE